MTKWIIACVLLCCTSLEVSAFYRSTFAVEANYSATALIGDDFYIVSKLEDYFRIDSSNEYYDHCYLPITNKSRDFIHSDMQAKSLGNGKVVLWGTHKESRHHVGGKWQTDYIVMIVNALYCTYETLSIFEDFTDSKPKNKPIVIAYENEFDIFLPSLKKCNPCRYNHYGNGVYVESRLPSYYDDYQIDAIMDPDRQTYGYVLAYKVNENILALKVLFKNFTIASEDFLDGLDRNSKVIISTNFGSYAVLGLCYEKADKDEVSTVCESRNSFLELQNKIVIRTSDRSLITNLKIDFHKNFYLAMAEKSSIIADRMDVNIKHVGTDGKVDGIYEPISFPAADFKMQSFIVIDHKTLRREFCVSLSYTKISVLDADDDEIRTEIRCFKF